MVFIRANRWISIAAFVLQIPTQMLLFKYPLMPDTLPQPWYDHAAFMIREYVLQYVEYPAIKLADAVFPSVGLVTASTVLFLAGFAILALLLVACQTLLRRVSAVSTL